MAKYIFKRICLAIVTIWAVATLTFFLMNLVPGGPFMSEKAVSPEAMAAFEAKYGLDKPLGEQYLTYMKDALHGDFGQSLRQRGRSVSSIIFSKFPVSAKVGGMAVVVALVLGVPLGCLAAFNRGKVWDHIISVSVADLKKNYENLNVEFDLWKGESDVHDIIPGMVEAMKKGGYAYESEGALVVDVKEETDTKEVPPCMILKSDGASLYNTTDLATIMDRMENYHPDKLIYLTDKRQELYFVQVFRCARKTGLVTPETELVHIGFGTMNGKDGKPFKTRDGGVMRLEMLLKEINEEMYRKIMDNKSMSEEEAKETAKIVALSAVKYGDLSNQASKDYIFDIDRFTSFEGDTGPYILYTIVRIKSILNKYKEQGGSTEQAALQESVNESEKSLMLEISKFNAMMETAYEEIAPHRICAYIYDLANAFNRFYHETKILTEEDKEKQAGWIALLALTRDILETCIDLLGFSAPERM